MTMNYKSNVFIYQFPIVKWFVYHLTYYRALSKGYREHQMQNEFWTLTIDAHLLRATINWCMVFGSHDSNPTHWKLLSATDSEGFNRSFREGLFMEANLDENSWKQYWRSMTDFRNKYAAHREPGISITTPNFDTALAVAYYYDSWVRRLIFPDKFEEPMLKNFSLSLMKSVVPLVEKLLDVTNDLAEPCNAK